MRTPSKRLDSWPCEVEIDRFQIMYNWFQEPHEQRTYRRIPYCQLNSLIIQLCQVGNQKFKRCVKNRINSDEIVLKVKPANCWSQPVIYIPGFGVNFFCKTSIKTNKGVLHPRSVFGLFLHFSQKLQHIGYK